MRESKVPGRRWSLSPAWIMIAGQRRRGQRRAKNGEGGTALQGCGKRGRGEGLVPLLRRMGTAALRFGGVLSRSCTAFASPRPCSPTLEAELDWTGTGLGLDLGSPTRWAYFASLLFVLLTG